MQDTARRGGRMEVDPRAALRSRNSSIGSMLALGAVTILALSPAATTSSFSVMSSRPLIGRATRYPMLAFFQNQPRHRNHSSGATALIAISYNPVRMAGFHWVIDLQKPPCVLPPYRPAKCR
jgi:hypothetical protein